MNVKSAFLNGPIKEEVYVEQPSGFESGEYSNHVYKLHKTLYELKQAPRTWYECLRDFLIKNNFMICKADSTLFTRKMEKDLFVCQIYIDDIIFDSIDKSVCDEFSKIMTDGFEMFMMGFLYSFLDFKSSKTKNDLSLVKQSTHATYSISLTWIMQSPSRLSWALMDILILIWMTHRLIKRYIAL
jgi:hypothetical protein